MRAALPLNGARVERWATGEGTNARIAGWATMFAKQLQTAKRSAIALDHRSHEAFEPYCDTSAMQAVDLFSKLGDQPEVRAISAAFLIAGIFASSNRLVRTGARMLIAHETATLAKDQLKGEIDRTRPRSAKARSDKMPRKGRHTAKEKTSFPSGHSAGAFAAARAFSREFPEYGAAALAAAGVVAASQVPRRAHYPSDIVAGAAIGLVAEALTNAAWSAAAMDERSEGPG